MAVEAHAGQTDKAGEPYILHPLRLMLRFDTSEEMIAAVLHDVIEDTELTLEDLRAAGFSDDVLDAISCLTRNPDESYEAFAQRAKANPIARRVKIADIEDNINVLRLAELSDRSLDRVRRYHGAWRMLTDG